MLLQETATAVAVNGHATNTVNSRLIVEAYGGVLYSSLQWIEMASPQRSQNHGERDMGLPLPT